MDISSETLFILVFLLISFLSWVTEKFKAARQGQIEPRVEQDDWADEQVVAQQGAERPREASLKEIFQTLGIPVVEEEPRTGPPPLPDPEPQPTRRAEISPPPLETAKPEVPEDGLSKAERAALEAIKKGETAVVSRRRAEGTTRLNTVRELLRHDQLRTAFVLKEILDAPRCQEDLHT